jgi:hypothetical protein
MYPMRLAERARCQKAAVVKMYGMMRLTFSKVKVLKYGDVERAIWAKSERTEALFSWQAVLVIMAWPP